MLFVILYVINLFYLGHCLSKRRRNHLLKVATMILALHEDL
jgi:hypothetical protein